MSPRQRRILDVLPLLLHTNHPQLPGFVDHATPARIEHFEIGESIIEEAQALFRGLPKLDFLAEQPAAISSLFLMGSLGSLAQSKTSDIDMWLCLARPVSADALGKLQLKCQRIECWASQQNVELHIFVMDLDAFRQGQHRAAKGEDCGSTQHLLLLDEFYRASVWLTGRMPRWWITPLECKTPSQAESYWRNLVDSGLINAQQWLDPGHIAEIPVNEFLGAGLWQLTKGLSSPYKSLLKLQLYRSYAEQQPVGIPLCQQLKLLVHSGCADTDQCDPYQLMLNRVTTPMLEQQQPSRANLVRRAFYLKTGIKLSFPSRANEDWRYNPLRALVKQWGWGNAELIELDNQQTWTAHQVFKERNELVGEMLSGYRTLSRVGQQKKQKVHISERDIRVLGNRLTAAFDARPGKIVDMNPGILEDIHQDNLTLIHYPGVWQLAEGRPVKNPPDHSILKQSPSLVEILSFCWQNQLIGRSTRIHTDSENNGLSRYELLQLSSSLRQLRQRDLTAPNWGQPPVPVAIQLFINVARDPMEQLSRIGLQKISDQNDPLSFSAAKEVLIQQLELLTINSWGEHEVQKFSDAPVSRKDSKPALLEALLKVTCCLKDRKHRPLIEVHCFNGNRAPAIRHRMISLLQNLLKHMRRSTGAYLFRMGARICYLSQKNNKYQYQLLESENAIWPLLEQADHGLPGLDPALQLESPLEAILANAHPNSWQLFYTRNNDRLTFFLVDQQGAILREEVNTKEVGYWMLPALRMLNGLKQHWAEEEAHPVNQIELMELIPDDDNGWHYEERSIPESSKSPANIELRAVIDHEGQATLYCNQEEFSRWQYGDKLYLEVARHVQSLRGSKDKYPCYLSGIQLPDNNSLLDHWRHKRAVERQLALALEGAPSLRLPLIQTTE